MKIIARQQAMKEGLPKYYTGKPCKYGHTTWRYTKSSVCVTCNNKAGAKTKLAETKPNPAEPELDYAQIGKAIIAQMERLRKLAEEGIEAKQELRAVNAEKGAALRKIKEQHDQIQKLNIRIQHLNESRSSVPLNDKFKLSEIATIK